MPRLFLNFRSCSFSYQALELQACVDQDMNSWNWLEDRQSLEDIKKLKGLIAQTALVRK